MSSTYTPPAPVPAPVPSTGRRDVSALVPAGLAATGTWYLNRYGNPWPTVLPGVAG